MALFYTILHFFNGMTRFARPVGRRALLAKAPRKHGPKGPDQAVINVIVDMKKRNLCYGCRRIAMQITLVFGIKMDKDTVRRVLNKHYKNTPEDSSPSWLTLDSLKEIAFK